MPHRKRHEVEKGPSLHERITQKIVDELKEGSVPWVKPWDGNSRVGLPRNYVSNRPYSGINVLLTWLSALEHGFTDTRWLTAKQIIELGGSFKGESATRILFAKSYTRAAGTADEETFFVHKAYNVFNGSQVSGKVLEPEELPPPFEARLEHAEAFIAAQGVPIIHGGDRAFYLPSKDAINLPCILRTGTRHSRPYLPRSSRPWESVGRCACVLGRVRTVVRAIKLAFARLDETETRPVLHKQMT